MNNTNCTATDQGVACTRDAGHDPIHWHEDDRGEIVHSWIGGLGK